MLGAKRRPTVTAEPSPESETAGSALLANTEHGQLPAVVKVELTGAVIATPLWFLVPLTVTVYPVAAAIAADGVKTTFLFVLPAATVPATLDPPALTVITAVAGCTA